MNNGLVAVVALPVHHTSGRYRKLRVAWINRIDGREHGANRDFYRTCQIRILPDGIAVRDWWEDGVRREHIFVYCGDFFSGHRRCRRCAPRRVRMMRCKRFSPERENESPIDDHGDAVTGSEKYDGLATDQMKHTGNEVYLGEKRIDLIATEGFELGMSERNSSSDQISLRFF
mmetsp:Transcript_29134/g.59111  ORF Transcript_29134/g.59111 Transcript_29134/m.59111 type:complete len:173 (+) Transcript_29134:1345-1863(+)